MRDSGRFSSFVDILRWRAEEQGDAEAVTFLTGSGTIGSSLSYAALDRRARAIGAYLQEVLSPSARALIAAPTGPAYVTAFFGCLYAGVIAVTAYPPRRQTAGRERRGGDPRFAAILDSAAPHAILGPSDVLESLQDQPHLRLPQPIDVDALGDEAAATFRLPVDPCPVALLQYTSGSTAAPRGVRVTQQNLLSNSALIQKRIATASRDRVVGWLPLFHDMGLVGLLLQPIYAGCPAVLMSPSDFLQAPFRWLVALSNQRATITVAPDWSYERCVKESSSAERAALDLTALRVCFDGAEPIRAHTLDAFARAFGPCGFRREAFLPCFGLAEATLLVSGGGPHRGRIHLVDSAELARGEVRPAADTASARELVGCGVCEEDQVLIVDPETNRRALPGRVGEIWVQGPSVADGYWDNAAATAAVFGARLADTGEGPFLRTGDLGFVIDGELVVAGRLKDMIIVRGENYYPQDIEQAVASAHSAIAPRGAAAFPVELEGREHCVVVAELTRKGLRSQDSELDEILTAVRGAVAESAGLMLVAVALIRPLTLPRTSSGKVRRTACKAAWLAGELALVRSWRAGRDERANAAGEAASYAETLQLIRAIAAEILHLPAAERVSPDLALRAAGLDSLGLISLKRRIEQALALEVPLTMLDDDPSFTVLAQRLCGPRAPQKTVAAGESRAAEVAAGPSTPLGMSLMFFTSNEAEAARGKYDHVLAAAHIADRSGFEAVWLPERHFHPFGGLFPDPAVLAAALAVQTQRIRLRAGSVVLPLHDPIAVLERWAMVDNLSNGRVDLALATGWDADSFCLAPEAYRERAARTVLGADELRRLWRGDRARRRNGEGHEVEVRPLPRPMQPELACWLTVAQRDDLIETAGERGLNVLTALLFQPLAAVAAKIQRYRDARRQAGLDPAGGRVTLMLHTYLGADLAEVRATVRPPFLAYLRSSIDLWGREAGALGDLGAQQREEVVHLAFERYFQTAGLFGTPETCAERVRVLKAAGVDEIACLVDFGVPRERLLASVEHIAALLRLLERPRTAAVPPPSRVVPVPQPQLDLEARHHLARQPVSDVFARARTQPLYRQLREAGLMPFYGEFGARRGARIQHRDREVLQLGSLDYLGLSLDERVCAAAAAAAIAEGTSRTGSRLHNGSTAQQRRFEKSLAEFLGREDALVFATGYQAQLGLISGLMDPDSVLLLDELAHAALYDGARIAETRIVRFAHSDPAALELALAALRPGTAAMVVCEGMYSNEGDLPPLREIAAVCRRHGARLALDEAHALGVLGARGRGIEEELELPGAADVVAGTLSKSLASIGGFIAGPAEVIDWIRFNARSILFSAAIAPASLAAGEAALHILMAEPQRVATLREAARLWRAELRAHALAVSATGGPIVPIYLADDLACLQAARRLLDRGIYVNAVVAPSAPRGKALLRTCVTALHEAADLSWAAGVIAETLSDISSMPSAQALAAEKPAA